MKRKLVDGGTCQARCVDDGMQTECVGGDGCCPATCNATNDSDCKASCGNRPSRPARPAIRATPVPPPARHRLHAAEAGGILAHLRRQVRGGRQADHLRDRRRLLPDGLHHRQRRRLRVRLRQRHGGGHLRRDLRSAGQLPPGLPADGLPAAPAGQRRHLPGPVRERRHADHVRERRRLLPRQLQRHQRQRLRRPLWQRRGRRPARPATPRRCCPRSCPWNGCGTPQAGGQRRRLHRPLRGRRHADRLRQRRRLLPARLQQQPTTTTAAPAAATACARAARSATAPTAPAAAPPRAASAAGCRAAPASATPSAWTTA